MLGVRVARGRDFTPRDNTPTSAPVVIVNESFARRFWPAYPDGPEPIGRQITVPVVRNDPFEIVGVVADVRQSGRSGDMSPQFYLPNALYPPQSAYVAIRASGDPALSMRAVREAVLNVDPDQSIADVRTMDQILDRPVGRQHMAAQLLGAFAGRRSCSLSSACMARSPIRSRSARTRSGSAARLAPVNPQCSPW